MSLEKLREQLSAVDVELVSLIGKRQRIVGDIGRDKRMSGQATRDYQREKVVLDMARQQADIQGVDPNVVDEIMSLLIRSSLTHQERYRVARLEGSGARSSPSRLPIDADDSKDGSGIRSTATPGDSPAVFVSVSR